MRSEYHRRLYWIASIRANGNGWLARSPMRCSLAPGMLLFARDRESARPALRSEPVEANGEPVTIVRQVYYSWELVAAFAVCEKRTFSCIAVGGSFMVNP